VFPQPFDKVRVDVQFLTLCSVQQSQKMLVDPILDRTYLAQDVSNWSAGTEVFNEIVQGPCAHLGIKCWDMGIVTNCYDKCSVG
jgi:hypothetical protein